VSYNGYWTGFITTFKHYIYYTKIDEITQRKPKLSQYLVFLTVCAYCTVIDGRPIPFLSAYDFRIGILSNECVRKCSKNSSNCNSLSSNHQVRSPAKKIQLRCRRKHRAIRTVVLCLWLGSVFYLFCAAHRLHPHPFYIFRSHPQPALGYVHTCMKYTCATVPLSMKRSARMSTSFRKLAY